MAVGGNRISRALKRIGYGLVVAAVTCGATTLPALALDKLRVGKSGPPMILTLVELGTEAGIWKDLGLEVEGMMFGGEAPTIQALIANSIDLGFGSGPGLAYPVKGVPATAIAAVSGAPFNLVLSVRTDTKLKSLDDLKGKTVGVTSSGSLTDWMVHEISRQKGWGPEGIKTFPSGASRTSLAALKAGDIDGVVMGAATAFDAQINGASKVFTSLGDLVTDFHSNVLFARNKLIAERPDLVQKFVDGWFRTVTYARSHPDVVVRVGAKTLGISEEAVRQAYEDEITRMLRDTGRFDPKAVEVIRRSLVEIGTLEQVPPADKLYDERFLKNH
jgi:ABC-type nitrate/sulfonate/bicarbonate transport system substrate-binding protein